MYYVYSIYYTTYMYGMSCDNAPKAVYESITPNMCSTDS